MKIFNKYNIVFSTVLGVLVGCGGDSSSPSHNNSQSPSPRWNQITSQDVNYNIPLAEARTIDLANYTQAINSGANLTLTDFKQIGERPSCTQYQVEQTQVVFEMGSAQECYYKYTIQDVESGSTSSAILRIAASSLMVEQTVKQFSVVTQIDDVVSITVNDGSTVPEGYVVDETSIQVLGHGSARVNELNPNEIYYYSGTEQSSQGLHRVMFSYINPDNQSVIQGLIDIAVGTSIENYAPRAVNFRYGDVDYFVEGEQLDHAYISIGQEVTINIAPYYNQGYLDSMGNPIEMIDDMGKPIFDEQGMQVHYYLESDQSTSTPIYKEGNYLIDRDKDILQVTNVYAYDAFVAIKNSDDFYNTELTFKAYNEGYHYITYVLSDHNGGYGTGVIELYVGKKDKIVRKPWDKFLYTEKYKYLSPLSVKEADDLMIPYTSISTESGVTGEDGSSTILSDYFTSEYICESNNMRLPTYDEIMQLSTIYPDGLYASKDIFNPIESKRNDNVNWPTNSKFWTKNDESGIRKVVSLSDYTYDEVSLSFYSTYATVCVSIGMIKEVELVRDNAFRLPLDKDEYNIFNVYLSDYSGKPLPGESIRVFLPGSYGNSLFINSNESDQNGLIQVGIRSRAPGQKTARFIFGDSTISSSSYFRNIPKYSRVGVNNELCFFDDFEVFLTGNCDMASNVIEDALYGNTGDTVFLDKMYAYRRHGNDKIHVYDDIASALSGPTQITPIHTYTIRFANIASNNAILYDGEYYWTTGNGYYNGYLTVDDMANDKNKKISYPLEPKNRFYGVSYDPETKLYLHIKNEGGSLFMQEFNDMKDVATYSNPINSYIWVRLHGLDEKFFLSSTW